MSSPFDHPQFGDVVLWHLCGFLNAARALPALAPVCSRFNRLMRSPLAKRVLRLRLSRAEQGSELLGRVLPAGEIARLEECDLCIPDRAKLLELPLSSAYVTALVEHAPRLHTLQLACVRLRHTELAQLSGLAHLTSLSLDFTPTSSAGLTGSSVTLDHHYYSALLQLKHLRRLRFVCSWNGRAAFLARLAGLTKLEFLELRFKNAELTLDVTTAWAASMPRLQELLLHKMTPTAGAEQPTDIFAPLAAVPMLTRLELPHSISSLAMYTPLTKLRSLSLLVAENTARGTDSHVAPLATLTSLTHLALTNQEAHADALLEDLVCHAPRSLTSLQLSLDTSLTRAGCKALEQLRPLRFLTLLNGELQLDPTSEQGFCSSAVFLARLEYLHVSTLTLVHPLQPQQLAHAPRDDQASQLQKECFNPLQFLSSHARQLEVLRVDDAWHLTLLPLSRCASLRVLGDASPTLYGYGNRGGTRSNVLRHPSLDDALREWLLHQRYLLCKDGWHHSATQAYTYAAESNALPAFMPGAKDEFFRRLATVVPVPAPDANQPLLPTDALALELRSRPQAPLGTRCDRMRRLL